MSAEDDGGVDLSWPTEPDLEPDFSLEVTAKLKEKGHCVIQCFLTPEAKAAAVEAVGQQEGWKRFIKEIEPGYLGRYPQGKVLWLPTDEFDREATSGLELCDRLLTEMSFSLWDTAEDAFQFIPAGRTDGLLRVPFADRSEEEAILREREVLDEKKIADGKLEDHIKFVQVRKICMVLFISGSGGSLTLHSRDGPDITIPIEEGRLVAFRHDVHSYTLSPFGDSVVLQAWVLAEPKELTLLEFDGPPEVLDRAMGLVAGPTTPIYGFTGKSVSLMSMDCMLAGNGLGSEFYWSFLVSGTDACREISMLRWDYELYYEPNKDIAYGKYYTNHGGFVLEEHLLGFDNDFFGITEEMASMMDPIQRNSLEVGYNVLYKAGWNRESLQNAAIGVFFGNCGTDWNNVKLSPLITPLCGDYMHSVSSHVTNSRISYIFGLKGALATSDTACSSSLVATGTAHNGLRQVEPDQLRVSNVVDSKWALVMGTNALLGPFSWIALSGPKMLSHRGRCFTFDHSADGFGRGEGTTGLTMHVTEKEPSNRLAMFCGTCINQDGRSASMTAPHGPSQQECLWGSLREANVVPADVRIAELHGTGTALGDPIEVGALRGVMKVRSSPIMKTSAKSNIAHGEANAGMAGLIKCFIMLMYSTTPPNVHLSCLNPHMDTNGYPVMFCDELCELGTNSGYAGVSSFGFGGTNARADLWAKATMGPRKVGEVDLEKLDYVNVQCPKCQGWMDHISATMMPSQPSAEPGGGRQKACCLRDEFDNYECCSLCYTGTYEYGSPPIEVPLPQGRIFISGSWDGFKQYKEMEVDSSGVNHAFIRLGKSRSEQFHLAMEMNEYYAFFPACERAGMDVRTMGPCELKPRHKWLIDGRQEGWAEGSQVHIQMWVEPPLGRRRVTWEVVEQVEDG